jgi:hypothetical protein
LEITWLTLPLSSDPANLIELAKTVLPQDTPKENPAQNEAVKRVETLVKYFTTHLDKSHRDSRYYVGGENGPKDKLNNLGLAWSLGVALNGWHLDATRSLRTFSGLPTSGNLGNTAPSHGAKDALNGRDPMLFGGSSEWLKKVHSLNTPAGGDWKKLFRHTDAIGAITLVKRLWHLAYLKPVWSLKPHPMPNTYELASGHADRDDDRSIDDQSDEDGKYYAVLAFDGDSIGQWVSGAKTPTFDSQLAQGWGESPHAYFKKLDAAHSDNESLLTLQRPLSPSYHLQFSEALSNFALHCAPRIVNHFRGKLLYTGGDDVLALIPAPYALACADNLQRVFRGLSPTISCGITELSPGFLTIEKDRDGRAIPLILPGPRTTASVGLVIAHFKQPLQDVVRAAQAAEKRAKKIDEGKHALGLTLMKRSGEIIVWDTRFDADNHTPFSDSSKTGAAHRGGHKAVQWLLFALGCDVGSLPSHPHPVANEVLSSKFPHRLCALLEPYLGGSDAAHFDADSIFERELDHALDRQRGKSWATDEGKSTRDYLKAALLDYFTHTPGQPTAKLQAMIGLLTTAAFLARQPEIKD